MEKNIEDYTREINNLTDANKEVYLELEIMSSAIIDKSMEMMAKQIKETIEQTVKNNPERTKKLNEEGKLKDVKEMMNSTLGNLSVYVNEAFSGSNIFRHRTLKLEKYKRPYEYSQEIKENYKEVYRILLGYAGNIICKFGYAKAGSDFNGHSTWKYISGSGGKIKYGARPDIREVEKEWKAYINLFEKYVNTAQEINELIEAKEKKEASDLWENI